MSNQKETTEAITPDAAIDTARLLVAGPFEEIDIDFLKELEDYFQTKRDCSEKGLKAHLEHERRRARIVDIKIKAMSINAFERLKKDCPF